MTSTPLPASNAMSRPLDTVATMIAIFICLSWGFSQVTIKLAMADVPPLTQAAIRSIGATCCVGLWMRFRGIPFTLRDGTLAPGLIAGCMFGIEFTLTYVGLVYTTASRAVLFIYLAPFFIVIGSRFLIPGDRFHPTQWLGLLLSFSGMVVAFGLPTPAADPRQWLGDVMMVVTALFFGARILLIKASRLATAPAEKTMLYQLVISALILSAGVLLAGERLTKMPGPVALGSLAFQTFWVLSISFALWIALVTRYSASRLSAFTFLAPLCGVAAGHLVLDEPLTPPFAAAVAMVAAGLILVNRRK
ncbi:MAG: DMT family transporter [Pseudorhodoplanes sp.]